jgi:hypothetical protein
MSLEYCQLPIPGRREEGGKHFSYNPTDALLDAIGRWMWRDRNYSRKNHAGERDERRREGKSMKNGTLSSVLGKQG